MIRWGVRRYEKLPLLKSSSNWNSWDLEPNSSLIYITSWCCKPVSVFSYFSLRKRSDSWNYQRSSNLFDIWINSLFRMNLMRSRPRKQFEQKNRSAVRNFFGDSLIEKKMYSRIQPKNSFHDFRIPLQKQCEEV